MSTAASLLTRAARAQPLGHSNHGGLLLQRKCACGSPTSSLTGDCAECQSKRRLQTRLAVGASNDPLEREADRVADQVLAPAPASLAMSGTVPRIQRFSGHAPGENEAVPASVDHVLATTGQPLAPELQQDMEHRFGHDFSRVRVHTGAVAEQSTKEVHADAYTVGHDIVFDAGRLAPGTREGRRLIAHELTHVVQQGGGETSIQRAPGDDTRWKRDVRAARYRGRLMANRIRTHTKLSKEARAKINSELAYFEGAAKDAYLAEVRPALLAVTEIEMPAERMVRRAPPPIVLSSLASDPAMCGGSKCFTDDDLNAPQIEARRQESEEAARLMQAQIDALKDKTKDWGADQAFAVALLENILRATNAPDPRAVSDKIRPQIVDRYRAWLKAVDKRRLDACAAGEFGTLAMIRARAQGDDPCVSWFDEKKGDYAHGPSVLHELEMRLKLNRQVSDTAVEKVYWEVLEYRKKTDPYWIKTEQQASAMVSFGTALAGGISQKVNAGKSVPPAAVPSTPAPTPTVTPQIGFKSPTAVTPTPPPTSLVTPQRGPIGFKSSTAVPPTPAPTTVTPSQSPQVAGFGRQRQTPPPPPATVPQDPPIRTQMPPARVIPSSPPRGGITGQRRDDPAKATAGKGSDDAPKAPSVDDPKAKGTPPTTGTTSTAPTVTPKQPYVNNNPKATTSEVETGTLLDGNAQAGALKGVSRVEGAAEAQTRSGDYRFVKPDGTKISADLKQPETTNTRSIVARIFKESGQANVVVLRLGKGTSGQLSADQAKGIAQDVLRTPGHSVERVIVIKDGVVIVDLP